MGEASEQRQRRLSRRRKQSAVVIALCVLTVLVAVLVIHFFVPRAYRASKEAAQQAAEQKFYQASYDRAERANHVKNEIKVDISGLSKEKQLIVLTVSDTEFVTEQAEQGEGLLENVKALVGVKPQELWLGVRGRGNYRVDLRGAECAVDAAHGYVLVRVPKPTLGDITVEPQNIEIYRNTGKGLIHEEAAKGVKLADKGVQEGQALIRESLAGNAAYYEAALENAKAVIARGIQALNPSYPELQVEVEFI